MIAEGLRLFGLLALPSMLRLRCLVYAVALALAAPVTAAPLWECGAHCLKKGDLEALQPVIQKLLKDAKVGDSAPWRSGSGRVGNIYLVEGGEQAQATTAKVRITVAQGKAERDWFTFLYRRDPKRGWGVVG